MLPLHEATLALVTTLDTSNERAWRIASAHETALVWCAHETALVLPPTHALHALDVRVNTAALAALPQPSAGIASALRYWYLRETYGQTFREQATPFFMGWAQYASRVVTAAEPDADALRCAALRQEWTTRAGTSSDAALVVPAVTILGVDAAHPDFSRVRITCAHVGVAVTLARILLPRKPNQGRVFTILPPRDAPANSPRPRIVLHLVRGSVAVDPPRYGQSETDAALEYVLAGLPNRGRVRDDTMRRSLWQRPVTTPPSMTARLLWVQPVMPTIPLSLPNVMVWQGAPFLSAPLTIYRGAEASLPRCFVSALASGSGVPTALKRPFEELDAMALAAAPKRIKKTHARSDAAETDGIVRSTRGDRHSLPYQFFRAAVLRGAAASVAEVERLATPALVQLFLRSEPNAAALVGALPPEAQDVFL